jgi:hypothetical protein
MLKEVLNKYELIYLTRNNGMKVNKLFTEFIDIKGC